MSLIICPECGGEISDKSEVCIHCGYPIMAEKVPEFDFNSECPVCKSIKWHYNKINGRVSCETCGYVGAVNKQLAKIYDDKQENTNIQEVPIVTNNTIIPKCPTCGSTNIERISAGKKLAGSMLFGLFSKDAKSTFHCKNCNYKW